MLIDIICSFFVSTVKVEYSLIKVSHVYIIIIRSYFFYKVSSTADFEAIEKNIVLCPGLIIVWGK